MKYTIFTFKRGLFKKSQSVEAKSHKEAVGKVVSYSPSPEYHFLVKGTTFRRYTNTGKLINGEPKIFPIAEQEYGDPKYGIILMINNKTELYYFNSKKERNQSCTALESAKTANPEKPLNAITVCLEGMLGSKSGSMFHTTSKTSAIDATFPDDSTRISTDESSMKGKYGAMTKMLFKPGSTASHSKPKKLSAVVNVRGKDDQEFPGINELMKEMDGRTIEVRLSDTGNYYGAGWVWRPEWLIFRTKTLKAMVMPESRVQIYTATMEKMVGTIIEVVYEKDDWYTDTIGYLWHKNSLKFVKDPDYLVGHYKVTKAPMLKINPLITGGS